MMMNISRQSKMICLRCMFAFIYDSPAHRDDDDDITTVQDGFTKRHVCLNIYDSMLQQ